MISRIEPKLEMRLNEAFDNYFSQASRGGVVRYARMESVKAAQQEVGQFYQVQSALRPLFGKEGLRPPDIGDHPDFGHIKGTDDFVYCPIATMFMDIESSTRMGIIYKPEDVYKIKNSFIRAAIELIACFDGHVHRIMGDAVMAFFGGLHTQPEQSVIDALNCASVLRIFVERTVMPKLEAAGYTEPFGIRIGVDYGSKEDVLWSSYGYPQSDEVTATSFYVDVASKLQHSAGRNQIMIGQSLKDFLDFPVELLGIKKEFENGGDEVEDRFISPNHTDKEGKPINYEKFQLVWDQYLALSPLGQGDNRMLESGQSSGVAGPIPVIVDVHSDKNGLRESNYCPVSPPLKKEKWLRFSLQKSFLPLTPYVVRYRVENHGKEAFEGNSETLGNHETVINVNTYEDHAQLNHWESTSFRGLHFMTIDVLKQEKLHSRTRLGVYVE